MEKNLDQEINQMEKNLDQEINQMEQSQKMAKV
jgi:hypothetical protein